MKVNSWDRKFCGKRVWLVKCGWFVDVGEVFEDDFWVLFGDGF